jgi:hypothetical protein
MEYNVSNRQFKKVIPIKGSLDDPGPNIEYMEITPDMAQMFLKTNTNNRNLYPEVVSRYARKMAAGKWKFAADPIRFDSDGTLIDGQHRLHACIEAGAAFTALVIRDLDPDIMEVIDSGKKRTAGDALSILRVPSANNVASACRWLLVIKQGGPGKYNARTFDTSDVVEMATRHPGMIDSVNICHGLVGCGRLGLMVMLHYVGTNLLGKVHESESFIKVFRDGTPGYEDDPALKLREYFLRARKLGATVDARSVYPNAVTAFNMRLKGKTLKSAWRVRTGEVTIDGLDLDLV